MAVRKVAKAPLEEQAAHVDEAMLLLPPDSGGNPAHEMQRLLVQRLGADLGQRIIAEQSANSVRIEAIISSMSRAAGPIGLVALVGSLIWLIL
jgi:hypothetical protein